MTICFLEHVISLTVSLLFEICVFLCEVRYYYPRITIPLDSDLLIIILPFTTWSELASVTAAISNLGELVLILAFHNECALFTITDRIFLYGDSY